MRGKMKPPKKKPDSHVVDLKDGPNMKTGPKATGKKKPMPKKKGRYAR